MENKSWFQKKFNITPWNINPLARLMITFFGFGFVIKGFQSLGTLNFWICFIGLICILLTLELTESNYNPEDE